MIRTADALARSAVFRDVDVRDVAATAARWSQRALGAGEMLWYESDPADALALVVDGELEVTVAARHISTVGPGEMVGEAAAFIAGEQRTAAVRARVPTQLLMLPQAGLVAMRREQTNIYDLLLERALVVLAERIETTLARITSEAATGSWPQGVDGGATRMTRARPAIGVEFAPPAARPALRLLPVLKHAPDPVLQAIERAMIPVRIPEGDALVVEGDPGDHLYLLADGRLEVFRSVPAVRGLRLATLRAGALVGTGGLLLGRPRNASCIAARDSWAWSLDRRSFAALGGEAGRLFREALLCALRTQLRSVGTRMARFDAGRNDAGGVDIPLDDFLGAAGGALAYQGSLSMDSVSPAALPFRDEIVPEDPTKRRLVDYVRGGIIGTDEAIETPYGSLRVTYADHGDTGRCLGFIEDFIRQEVMPFYASTQTEHSNGRQTTAYREDAREVIRECVGATSEDAIIFCGSGATGAINKLVDILNIRLPADLTRAYSLDGYIPIHRRPVVFIGPYEHHSNELPWRHSLAELVVIRDDDDGRIDLGKLEDALIKYATRPLKIGSFSAASNATGIVSDVRAVSVLLHRHGALAFWDYAAAAPHARVDMNPTDGPEPDLAYKDAVFLSPHKLVGGPGSPGVLVVKKNLVRNSVPTEPGSGTVVLVTPESTIYRQAAERREEAGTPAIIESIRAGLAFGLQRAVGHDTITEMERGFTQRAIATWQQNPNLRLLGAPGAERLPMVSFLVRYGRTHYLHNNYVVALLNDLFGIQARGGTSCAMPYMHRLLGIGPELSREYLAMVEKGFASITPGWTRVGFDCFTSNAELRYVVAAVDLTARYGHLLLPDYEVDLTSGLWRHARSRPATVRRLADLGYRSGKLEYASRHLRLPESALGDQLEAAMRAFERAQDDARSEAVMPVEPREGEYERLRWFVMPDEVAHDLGMATVRRPR